MDAVRDILENELGLDIPLSGLVKDEKHRTSQLMIWKSARNCTPRSTESRILFVTANSR